MRCSHCGYDLAGLDRLTLCPECGAAPDQQFRLHDGLWYRRQRLAFALLMLPSWGFLAILVIGWCMSHWIIGFPDPGWVQHGQHAVLDLLGGLAMLSLAASLISLAAAPIALPAALLATYRYHRHDAAARWQGYGVILLLSLPLVVEIALMRPLGGPPWGLVNWIPD